MEIDNGQETKNYYVITKDEYEKSRNNAEFMNMLYDECLKEKDFTFRTGANRILRNRIA